MHSLFEIDRGDNVGDFKGNEEGRKDIIGLVDGVLDIAFKGPEVGCLAVGPLEMDLVDGTDDSLVGEFDKIF
jgi:hypothetical protein